MKKILLVLMFVNSFIHAHNECTASDMIFMRQLELKYATEIQELNYKFENAFEKLTSSCHQIEETNKTILLLPYAEGNEAGYRLSIILAIVNSETRKVEQSYFHDEIAQSDAIYVSRMELDTSLYYENMLHLSITLLVRSRAESYHMNKKFLYKIKKNSLSIMLDGLELLASHGQYHYDVGSYDGTHTYEWVDKESFKEGLSIRFKHQYNYDECLDEEDSCQSWNVVLEPITLSYKNEKYPLKSKIKPIFNLKEIEENTKKGLKYKEIVLKAMLFEEPLFEKNLNRYSNIAYYLQKNGHNKEAIFLLEKIVLEFPQRMVAYLNLGDAYWNEKKPFEALNNYSKYIKFMEKEKNIPPYVLQRVINSKGFSKGGIGTKS